MHFDYLNVLVFASVGLAFVFANVLVASVIRPQRKTEVGLEVYECGEPTIGDTWIRFDIRYYTVALIYVIFAVEITFLFPWAMVLTEAFEHPRIGFWAVGKGFLFVTILFFGLVAVWVKGDLDWVMTYEGERYVPTARREYKPIPSVEELEPAPATAAAHGSEGAATGEEAA